MMRVIIAGGRDFGYKLNEKNERIVDVARVVWARGRLDSLHALYPSVPWEVLCGMADGADKIGHNWAVDKGMKIWEYPANWAQYGKGAGPIRNELMARNATMLIAFWDGKSRGTLNMISSAVKYTLEVHVLRY